eukprot:1934823-Lingulodinium_polyedra.AAC.1
MRFAAAGGRCHVLSSTQAAPKQQPSITESGAQAARKQHRSSMQAAPKQHPSSTRAAPINAHPVVP